MSNNPHKPVPLKVFGRSHYACKRCKLLKTKCSGELPCSNCKAVNKADLCVYPTKDRKIVIMQSDLDSLNAKVEDLEKQIASARAGANVNANPNMGNVAVNSTLNPSILPQMPIKPTFPYNQEMYHTSPTQPTMDHFFKSPYPTTTQLQQLPPSYFSNPNGAISSNSGNNSAGSSYPPPYNGLQNPQSQSTLLLLHSPDIVQERILADKFNVLSGDMGLENFLLPDFVTDVMQGKMYDLAYHKLPEKRHALDLIHKVNNTYSGEFYLLDMETIMPILDDVYEKWERRNAFSDVVRKTHHGQLCYLFSTLAFGEQLLNSHMVLNLKVKIPGIEYYLLALQLAHLNREEIDLSFIQTALILGLYSVNLNRYNTVYNFFGVAVRSTLAKGLHRKVDKKLTGTPEEIYQKRKLLEKMKRVFWSVYVIDTTWSTHRMSLPVHINYVDTDADLPLDDLLDLQDNFDVKFLELNVHLSKYIAKSIKLIHGANMRTLSISYVNTAQFNQKQQAKNCLSCLRELTSSFEEPCLGEFDRARLFTGVRRSLTNLFLRFHQLVIIITRPLLMLIFTRDAPKLDNPVEIQQAIIKGIQAAHIQIDILLTFYSKNQLFVLGFWDSQHLFSAIMVAIIGAILGRKFDRICHGVALLKYMADHNNINALNCMKKLAHVNEFLVQTPEIGFTLNLRQSIQNLEIPSSQLGNTASLEMFSAPLTSFIKSSVNPSVTWRPFEDPISSTATPSSYSSEGDWNDGINNYSSTSKNVLFNMINSIQSWDVYADKSE